MGKSPAMVADSMALAERLSALQYSKLAVWVYDNDEARIRWANHEALLLWKAPTLDDLLARDYADNSPSTQARLDSYMRNIRKGEEVAEDWTLYPKGKPATMTLFGSGVSLDDGRLAILFQAMLKDRSLDESMIRGVEALRHTSLLVSLLDDKGEGLFHNPAVLQRLGEDRPPSSWFQTAWPAIQHAVAHGEVYRSELPVELREGQRWHFVEARPATDPVTGKRGMLLQQSDVTERRQAEELAESRSQLLAELHHSLAVVEEQRQQILSLSAPILDVGRGTLAVPIIGELHEARGSELGERLLTAVSEKRAAFVILDLTGCGNLDEEGARLLLRLSRAIGLLGSRAVITGVAAVLAHTIVRAGVDLSQLTTLRTLRDGLEFCRRSTS
jgi:rsbT co-antagonist protein RsbR